MTRPFGNNSGGLGGGGMMRTVQRSLRTGVSRGGAKDPFPHSPTTGAATAPNSPTRKSYKTPTNLLSLSSSFIQPPSAALPTWNSFSDDEWECVEEGDFGIRVSDDDSVFGTVPCQDEILQAVSALHQVVDSASFSQTIRDRFGYNSDKDSADGITSPARISSPTRRLNGRELDWFEPSLQLCNSRALSIYGPDKVYDAFHLLQTEPGVQRMVVSLSTDKAVWDAVMNNEVVRELRQALSEAEDGVSESSKGRSTEAATNVFNWIFRNTKAKIMEIIEKVTNLVNELFPEEEEKTTNAAATGGKDMGMFGEKLRTSFMLSIIVLLIVVVSRAQGA